MVLVCDGDTVKLAAPSVRRILKERGVPNPHSRKQSRRRRKSRDRAPKPGMLPMVTHYGIPRALYTDGHTIFFSPKKDKLTIEEELELALTQFGRVIPLPMFRDYDGTRLRSCLRLHLTKL
jgi:hypothetical protein